jgi:hypothetical protein
MDVTILTHRSIFCHGFRTIYLKSAMHALLSLLFCHLIAAPLALSATNEHLSEAKLVKNSPDISMLGTFDPACNPAVFDGLISNPMMIARLWEAYGFSPYYKVQMRGDAIHVNDPTGIEGDLYLAERADNRRVFLGIGAINHALVPAFKGKMTLILTTSPKGSGSQVRVEVYVRTDSRVIGFLSRRLASPIQARMENRMTLNAKDICSIIADISTSPAKVAGKLKREDAAVLLKLIPPESAPTHR